MRFRLSGTLFLGVGLAAALTVIVGLIDRLHGVRDDLVAARQRAAFLHEGSVVPAVGLSTVTGDSLLLGEPDSLRAAANCCSSSPRHVPTAKRRCPVWQGLADSVRRVDARVQVIGVSLDSVHLTAAYVAANHITYPVVTLEDVRTIALYRALMVPQTVVVGAEGLVRYARIGELREDPALDPIYEALFTSPDSEPAGRVARR